MIQAVHTLECLVEDIETWATHADAADLLYAWDRLRKRIDRIQANPVTYRHTTWVDPRG